MPGSPPLPPGPLNRRERLEVSTENAIEILGGKPRPLDLPQDGAVIVAAVAGRVAIGAVAPEEAARRAQRPQGAMAQRLVEIRAGEIHQDVLPLERVIPERAIPRNPRIRVDDLQARGAPREVAKVAALLSRAQGH